MRERQRRRADSGLGPADGDLKRPPSALLIAHVTPPRFAPRAWMGTSSDPTAAGPVLWTRPGRGGLRLEPLLEARDAPQPPSRVLETLRRRAATPPLPMTAEEMHASAATYDHRLDVKESPTCEQCHGDVAAMVQVEQVESLKMGQCVDCHRDNGAPTDCAACHH